MQRTNTDNKVQKDPFNLQDMVKAKLLAERLERALNNPDNRLAKAAQGTPALEEFVRDYGKNHTDQVEILKKALPTMAERQWQAMPVADRPESPEELLATEEAKAMLSMVVELLGLSPALVAALTPDN